VYCLYVKATKNSNKGAYESAVDKREGVLV
jgi:hypothetical protein